MLARFASEVEKKLRVTVSIGLSCNKFLAKIASDLDKPSGFAVLGASEAQAFLADKPVSFIFGFHRIADLQRVSEVTLMRRLDQLARGVDTGKVSADRETKSVSAEMTFDRDIADFRSLERILWSQAEKVFTCLKEWSLAGSTVTLKLKAADFRLRTRAHSLGVATQLAGKIFAAARSLLECETDGTKFRLLGVSIGGLTTADQADPSDFVDDRAVEAEHVVDRVRARFGEDAVVRGLPSKGRRNADRNSDERFASVISEFRSLVLTDRFSGFARQLRQLGDVGGDAPGPRPW